ncbi:MAG: S8 family peptidase [Cytophagales bacterium]|nr:S8 family peptidase [Cytophagales bacterium]MDW8384842.1 S8 family serine peptidase [Flammeovirgaceae bacterium]
MERLLRTLKTLIWLLSFGVSAQTRFLPLPDEPIQPEKVQPGKVVAYFTEEPNDNIIQVLSQYRVTQLRQLFPPDKRINAPKPPQHLRRIHQWYEISYESSISPHEFSAILMKYWFVEYAEPRPYVRVLGVEDIQVSPPNDPHKGWGLDSSRVYDAWDASMGDSNQVIAVLDYGINVNSPDFTQQLKRNWAEINGISGVDDDLNGYIDDTVGYNVASNSPNVNDVAPGHGTEVAGVALGCINNNFGVAGTCPECRLLPVAIFSYTNTAIEEGIYYAALNGAKIINLSFENVNVYTADYRPGYYQFQQDLITYLTETYDILFVAAAGNTYWFRDTYPASYKDVVSVTMAQQDKNVYTFNGQIGAFGGTNSYYVDLLAPGANLPLLQKNGTVIYGNGTSYASPFVAGIAGLLRSKYPTLKARQIAELLRITADTSVYQLPNNADKRDRLGYGFLRADKAIAQAYPSPAVRADEIFIRNLSKPLYGSQLFPGDTFLISAKFINYLGSTSDSITLRLRSTTPYMVLIDSVLKIKPLNTLDTAYSGFFKARLLTADTVNKILFYTRIGYESGTYKDWQYFDFQVTPAHYVPRVQGSGQIIKYAVFFSELYYTGLRIMGDGTLGYFDSTYTGNENGYRWAIGYSGTTPPTYPITQWGRQWLYKSGLMIGKSPSQVSDAVYFTNGSVQKDFRRVRFPKQYRNDYKEVSVISVYDDSVASNPIGVEVTEKLVALNEGHLANSVVIEYDVKNISTVPFDSLMIGLYTDWTFPSGDSIARWDSAGKFGFSRGSHFWATVRPLAREYQYFALDKPNVGGDNINITDNFSDAEKFHSLTTTRAQAGVGDVAMITTIKVRNLAPGESQLVVFHVNLDSIHSQMIAANNSTTLQNRYKSDKPVVSKRTFCPIGSTILQTDNKKRFELYDHPSLLQPIYVGSQFAFTAADTSKTFYMRAITSALPSDTLILKLKLDTSVCENIWNGTLWSLGVNPTDKMKVILNHNYPNNQPGQGSFSCNKLIITPSATLTILPHHTILVKDTLRNNGSIVVTDSGSLVQTQGSVYTGTGSFTALKRGFTGLRYNYWSSPVQNAPLSLFTKVYWYNEALNVDFEKDWIVPTGNMVSGRGYAAVGAGLRTFSGLPHNGNISIPVTHTPTSPINIPAQNGWNLVGNPYPSAIRVDSFILHNLPLLTSGALYFWDDDNSGGGYSSADYAVRTIATGLSGAGGRTPGITIASCQGFFLQTHSNGSIQFTNAMRTSGGNSQFFRTESQSQEELLIRLSNADQVVSQTLVLLRDDATDSFDILLDAPKFLTTSKHHIYTLLDTQRLAIQAFSPQIEMIPLGITGNAGIYQLSLITQNSSRRWSLFDARNGSRLILPENQSITIYHPGNTLENRLFLRVETTESVLKAEHSSFVPLLAYVSQEHLIIEVPCGTEVRMYDIAGRLITAATAQENFAKVPIATLPSGVYLIKSADGRTAKWQK